MRFLRVYLAVAIGLSIIPISYAAIITLPFGRDIVGGIDFGIVQFLSIQILVVPAILLCIAPVFAYHFVKKRVSLWLLLSCSSIPGLLILINDVRSGIYVVLAGIAIGYGFSVLSNLASLRDQESSTLE